MNSRPAPEWFTLTEQATTETMRRIAGSVENLTLPLQVRHLPMQAHWFILDSLLFANRANREGMHANALALTRQCIEALSIIELGLCQHPDAESKLLQWEASDISAGQLRRWLSQNVWPTYGSGLWNETWSDFMGHLANAVQAYAHYTSHLAKWQLRLHGPIDSDDDLSLAIEIRPRAYDAQKATRITLYHAILTYCLARVWIANCGKSDQAFSALANRLRVALGKSKYLDGHQTNWDQQFWATVWSKDGGTILE